MAAGCYGLCARPGERRGRRELGLVYRNQEKGSSSSSTTVNDPPSPHAFPHSAEAQEITFLLRSICDYGLVRLMCLLSALTSRLTSCTAAL